jgi:predicted O-methyltransferase YrrM
MSESALHEVLAALRRHARVTLVWPRGLLHPGGPHRRLAGMLSPISIGDDECLVFGRLVEAFRPAHALVIGNGFGLSSAYLAHAMRAHGGASVLTLDSQGEGDGARCAEVARRLTADLDLRLLRNKRGTSPADLPAAIEAPAHQLVFIDGCHFHPQVTRDFEAALAYASADALFVWHDYWIDGVARSVAAARRRGLLTLCLPTSCEMVVGTRDLGAFARLRELFPAGEQEVPPRPRWVAGVVLADTIARHLWERVGGAPPG